MKYLIYTIFCILLLNGTSLFAKMDEIPTIDVILEQSSSVMIDNVSFCKTQKKQMMCLVQTHRLLAPNTSSV